MKWVRFALGSLAGLIVAVLAAVHFGSFEIRGLKARIDSLEAERAELLEYARRLSASHRVAQVDVVGQQVDALGRTLTELVFQEVAADATLGKPVTTQVIGSLAYFEALVIKFEPRFVGEGDPARATSLALFRRIFGDQQSPESVPELDRAARPVLQMPEKTRVFHDRLWQRFWKLVDDPGLARQFGVRVAQVEAAAVPVAVGQTWEVTLDALGGFNLRRIERRTR